MKIPPLFITATGTDIGKTYITSLLIHALGRRGVKTAAFKPIETGVIAEPADGAALQRALLSYPHNPLLDLETIVPVRYALAATPAVAAGDSPIDWPRIDEAFVRCCDGADIVLIEGAGGVLSPLQGDRPLIDLARRFEARVLLIAPDRLGMIHDLLAAHEALDARGFTPLLGVNRRGDEGFDRCTRPWLERHLPEALLLPEEIETLTEKVLKC